MEIGSKSEGRSWRWRRRQTAATLLACWALGWSATLRASPRPARERYRAAPFKYVGGTEKIRKGCRGELGLTASSMVFRCPEGSITIPYHSILVMQYRAEVSPQVRRMGLAWRFAPRGHGGNHNRYFTVVYRTARAQRAMILAVSPKAMRPYLAEIDLKVGRRVQVETHEHYY